MAEKEPLYISPGEKGKRGFEDLECYQRAGSQEFGNKKIHEDQAEYDATSVDDDESRQT
jgi:hypothetical protein